MGWPWAAGVHLGPAELRQPSPRGAGGAARRTEGKRAAVWVRVKPGCVAEDRGGRFSEGVLASQTLFSVGFLSVAKLPTAIPFTQIGFLPGRFRSRSPASSA